MSEAQPVSEAKDAPGATVANNAVAHLAISEPQPPPIASPTPVASTTDGAKTSPSPTVSTEKSSGTKYDYSDYWKVSAYISSKPEGMEALKHSELLNAKSGALIGHVTLMVVASSWFLTFEKLTSIQATSFNYKLVLNCINISLALEVLVYLSITFFCLRSLWVTMPETYKDIKTVEEALPIFIEEVTFRKSLFLRAIKLTMWATGFFIVSFIAKSVVLGALFIIPPATSAPLPVSPTGMDHLHPGT